MQNMNIEVDTILTRYKKYLFTLSHNEQIESINKVIKNHEKIIRKLKNTKNRFFERVKTIKRTNKSIKMIRDYMNNTYYNVK